MAKMKKGTSTGKVDVNYRTIKVGDYVKSKHTHMEFVVNAYGALENYVKTEKGWAGSDYIITRRWDASLAEEHEERMKAAETAAEAEVVKEDPAVPGGCEEVQVDWRSEAEGLRKDLEQWKELAKEAGDTLEIEKKKHEEGIAALTDQQLAAELRARGFEVQATKVITMTL